MARERVWSRGNFRKSGIRGHTYIHKRDLPKCNIQYPPPFTCTLFRFHVLYYTTHFRSQIFENPFTTHQPSTTQTQTPSTAQTQIRHHGDGNYRVSRLCGDHCPHRRSGSDPNRDQQRSSGKIDGHSAQVKLPSTEILQGRAWKEARI